MSPTVSVYVTSMWNRCKFDLGVCWSNRIGQFLLHGTQRRYDGQNVSVRERQPNNKRHFTKKLCRWAKINKPSDQNKHHPRRHDDTVGFLFWPSNGDDDWVASTDNSEQWQFADQQHRDYADKLFFNLGSSRVPRNACSAFAGGIFVAVSVVLIILKRRGNSTKTILEQ